MSLRNLIKNRDDRNIMATILIRLEEKNKGNLIAIMCVTGCGNVLKYNFDFYK